MHKLLYSIPAICYSDSMPRGARIDAPGVLHHVIGRGIERRDIFRDDADREDFIDRLEALAADGAFRVAAWALMRNHFHLLCTTGNRSISASMHRLLTGYVVNFNKRRRRHGYLFQNRFKSIVCQEERYLKELVRYIHLNPVRAGQVSGTARPGALPVRRPQRPHRPYRAPLAGRRLGARLLRPRIPPALLPRVRRGRDLDGSAAGAGGRRAGAQRGGLVGGQGAAAARGEARA
jgi:REP element-mobilizing transposase RayT